MVPNSTSNKNNNSNSITSNQQLTSNFQQTTNKTKSISHNSSNDNYPCDVTHKHVHFDDDGLHTANAINAAGKNNNNITTHPKSILKNSGVGGVYNILPQGQSSGHDHFDGRNEAGRGKLGNLAVEKEAIEQKYKVRKTIRVSDNKYIIIYDSGADLHLCNNRNAFMRGSLRPSKCTIEGIDAQVNNNSSNDHGLISYECGDIEIGIGKHKHILHDVPYVDERLDDHEDDNERNTILLSIRLLSIYNKLGIFFPAGGHFIEFYDEAKALLDKIRVSVSKDEAFIIRGTAKLDRKNQVFIRNSKIKRVEDQNEVKSISASDSATNTGSVNHNQQNDQKATGDTAKSKVPKAHNIAKDISQCNFEKVRTAETPKQNKKLSPKTNKKSRSTGAPRLVKKLHDRMHFGKTKPVINFLKDAYGLEQKDFDQFFENDPCDACGIAKSKILKPQHKNERPKPTKPGERLAWDIFTAPVRTKEGVKYILIIIDIYSDYIWAYPLRYKSEASQFLIALIKRLDRDAHRARPKSISYVGESPKVQGVRADGGGENWTKEFLTFCKNKGIDIEESLAYCQYQNGAAERVGAIVWETGQAMRLNANLPKTDWFRSMSTFVHQKNRLPNSKHPTKTPLELFYQFDANPIDLIENFKVFGSLVFVNYPKEVRKGKGKLFPKAWKGVFMGYADEAPELNKRKSRGFVIRDIQTGEIKTAARSMCIHHENVFPYRNPDKNFGTAIYNDIDVDIHKEGETSGEITDVYNKKYSQHSATGENECEAQRDRDEWKDSEPPQCHISNHYDDDDDEYKYDDLPSMCETSDDGDSSDEDIIGDDTAALNSGFPISSDPNRRNTRSHHNKNHNISTNIHQVGEKAGDNDVDEMDEKHIHNDDDEYDEKHVDINDINASYYDNSDAKASEPEADVNDIDYDDNYALENIIAHKYTATGGTNYLCQWDVGDKYTYSFEPNSSLKGQDLDAYNIYTNNLKHNKDETHLITDEAESKAGPILHEYQHDNPLIKDVYDARGWDHDKNTPIGEVDAAGGSETMIRLQPT